MRRRVLTITLVAAFAAGATHAQNPAGQPAQGQPAGTAAKTPVVVDASDIANLVVTMNGSLTLAGRFVCEGMTRTTIQAIPIAVAGGGSRAPETRTVETPPPPQPGRTPTVVAEPANGSPRLGLPRSIYAAGGHVRDAFQIEGLKGPST